MQMAIAVQELASTIKGKQALAIQGFARALRQIPTIISDNGGYDSSELIQALKVELKNGKLESGLNMSDGSIASMKELGIRECFRAKEQALLAASEAAEMIMRVDDVIRCAPRKRTRE